MKDRIKLLKPNLIFYDEVPVQTLESLNVMFERVFELSAGLNPWFLIVDIRNTNPPTLEIRNRLREIYADVPGLKHVVLITGMSKLLGLIVCFVAGRSIKIPYSIVKDLEAALAIISRIEA